MYDERIIIEKRTTSYDKGKKDEAWNEYYKCWCDILDLYGKEKYEAYNSKLENSLKFKCKFCKKLNDMIFETKEYRVIWKGKIFKLMFIDTLNNSKKDILLQVIAVT